MSSLERVLGEKKETLDGWFGFLSMVGSLARARTKEV